MQVNEEQQESKEMYGRKGRRKARVERKKETIRKKRERPRGQGRDISRKPR